MRLGIHHNRPCRQFLLLDRLVVSQCAFPRLPLEVSLDVFQSLGFRRLEAFTFWTASRLDPDQSPELYLELAARYGHRFHGLHFPPLSDQARELPESLRLCEKAIALAGRLQAGHVYLSAKSEDALVGQAARLLDACEEAGVVGLLEPHDNTPVHNLSSTLRVLERIGDDRLKVVLELGHLARAGDHWRTFYEALGGARGGRIASVHLKNVHSSGQWAPWKQGTIDLPAVLETLRNDGYSGVLVLENQLPDFDATRRDLQDLAEHVVSIFDEKSHVQVAP